MSQSSDARNRLQTMQRKLLHQTKMKMLREMHDKEVRNAFSADNKPQDHISHTTNRSRSDLSIIDVCQESSGPKAGLEALPKRPASAPLSTPAGTAHPDKTYKAPSFGSNEPSARPRSCMPTFTASNDPHDEPSKIDNELTLPILYECLNKLEELNVMLATERQNDINDGCALLDIYECTKKLKEMNAALASERTSNTDDGLTTLFLYKCLQKLKELNAVLASERACE